MNEQANERPATTPAVTAAPAGNERRQAAEPLLQAWRLRYPRLFGELPQPLKRGIYQDLVQRHEGEFTPAQIKLALALHTRSMRYLDALAQGGQRCDLEGAAVEPVAPEHVYQALVEVFRRRQQRRPEDQRPRLRKRLAAAFEASGLSRQEYLARVQPADGEAAELLHAALADSAARTARHEAMRRAYAAAGCSVDEFAAMYGLPRAEVLALLGPAGERGPGG